VSSVVINKEGQVEPLQMTTLAPTLATTALATSTLPSRFRRRAYALAAALSLSAICSAELRVAFWPLLAAWPHAVLAHSSPRPLEGIGRAPRPSPGNGARSLAYMQGAGRITWHGQATSNGGQAKGRREQRAHRGQGGQKDTGSMSTKADAMLI